MTEGRDYYNRRVGMAGERPRLALADVTRQIAAMYRTIDANGYLQRSFGYQCVDAGEVPGLHGTDLRMELFMRAGIKLDASVSDGIESADEVTLFTIVEFVHDHVAKPGEDAGHFHSWNNCGLHLNCRRDKFDEREARAEWRAKVNTVLRFYEDGYQLSEAGEIVRIASHGMEKLIVVTPVAAPESNNAAKLANAVHTFQLGRSTREQRKQAVRELVDILEFHRDVVKAELSKDEADLFNIANNFALRHHRATQKDDYDDAWLTWLFYVYLATSHLVLGRVAGVDPFVATASQPSDASVDDDIPF
jgi:hypothetical protein